MIDIKLIRENEELVKENIKKKFQDEKLPLVDEVKELDVKVRDIQTEADNLRAERNKKSKQIGACMAKGDKEEAEKLKAEVEQNADRLKALEEETEVISARIKEIMMTIPNIIDDVVPIGKDDTENVERQKFGEPAVPEYEIPYHVDIMESLNGIDLMQQERLQEAVSTTSWVILQDYIQQSSAMQEIS